MELSLNADLTVLSACKTGSGELITGEGVMGMSRAFLVAGSRAVLVSLWSVDSAATEELMVAFYRELRGGKAAADALRAAKLKLIRRYSEKRGSARGLQKLARDVSSPDDRLHPFFWSAFVLVGG
jgi:CHAT domain-containing protein